MSIIGSFNGASIIAFPDKPGTSVAPLSQQQEHPSTKLGSIYLITNKVNGKKYVGQTIQPLATRWSEHKSQARRNSKLAMHGAIKKYGAEAFSVEVIAESLEPFLGGLEQMYIKLFCTHVSHHGYNLTTGGEGVRGYVISDETKAKISAALTGRKLTPLTDEHRAKISAAHKGRKRSPEAIEAVAASLRGRKLTPEHIAKVVAAKEGYKHSDETKQKISAAQKGKPGVKHSPETRARMSESQLIAWASRGIAA